MSAQKIAILDTSILLQSPEILAISGNQKIVIPEAVVREFTSRARNSDKKNLLSLVDKAIVRGAEIRPSPTSVKAEPSLSELSTKRLDGADIDIIRTAIDHANRHGTNSVVVVTNDKDLRIFLTKHNIESIDARGFIDKPSSSESDSNIREQAESIKNNQRRFLLLNALFGLIASIIGNLVFENFLWLINKFTVWLTIVVTPILGIFLFWIRQHYRLLYGSIEFFSGVVITLNVYLPDFNYSKIGAIEFIQILGGLYVMVRGLDNIGQGLGGTRFEPTWKNLFK